MDLKTKPQLLQHVKRLQKMPAMFRWMNTDIFFACRVILVHEFIYSLVVITSLIKKTVIKKNMFPGNQNY